MAADTRDRWEEQADQEWTEMNEAQPIIHVCGGVREWGRGVFRCPFCMERRRGLLALVFGGYGSNGICGGCGSRFQDGEGRFESNSERADEGIAFVRERWAKARSWRTVSREVLAQALEGSE